LTKQESHRPYSTRQSQHRHCVHRYPAEVAARYRHNVSVQLPCCGEILNQCEKSGLGKRVAAIALIK
jgi:hypothetical protein